MKTQQALDKTGPIVVLIILALAIYMTYAGNNTEVREGGFNLMALALGGTIGYIAGRTFDLMTRRGSK